MRPPGGSRSGRTLAAAVAAPLAASAVQVDPRPFGSFLAGTTTPELLLLVGFAAWSLALYTFYLWSARHPAKPLGTAAGLQPAAALPPAGRPQKEP